MLISRRALALGGAAIGVAMSRALPSFARTAGATFMTGDADATLGRRYADAWTSHDPAAVAGFFAMDGAISINGGAPSVGRAAIAAMAKGFYDDFPDLVVRMDDFRRAGANALFAWTLEGHHSRTRNHVRVGGWEEWSLSDEGLITLSRGHFDADDYARQIETGV